MTMMMISSRRMMVVTLMMTAVGLTLLKVSASQDGNETEIFDADRRVIVTNQAMGARSAVAADFDGDGRLDLVSASSNDNAVSWFRNEGPNEDGIITFGIKKEITWSSLGSRIATVADIDGDGDIDVIGASYYDSSLRWFENDGEGGFTSHLISSAVNEGQGVTVADVDNNGTPDVISASSGDNTIAVFKNFGGGIFCEIKEVVDNEAIGARTVVAADLNGDGWIDLASASKDDDTVAWYPNDGTGHFPTKIVISAGEESAGAYSLVAEDVDKDGTMDLIVASNGNDHVSLWRNIDGKGTFEKTLIYDQADFVLSVTAVDFDRDGDIDVASASFFDGRIIWYENVDGMGYEWKNHTIYTGIQGHYVSHADIDGDGDDDLIAVTHAENTVAVYLAKTSCDVDNTTSSHAKQECCHSGTEWNGESCEPCPHGTYGSGSGLDAKCKPCPTDSCVIPGLAVVPATCSGITTGCADLAEIVAECSCPVNTQKDSVSDECVSCPTGQIRPDLGFIRDVETIGGNYSVWEATQGVCQVQAVEDNTPLVIGLCVAGAVVFLAIVLLFRRNRAQAKADSLWTINKKDITYDDPVLVLGVGSFGEVQKGYYRGTAVAIKRAVPNAGGGLKSQTAGLKSGRVTMSGGLSSAWASERIGLESSKASSSGPNQMSTKQLKAFRKDFITEMRILSKIRHPCITTVMGAVLGEEPLLVMEFMENGSLRDLLSNQTFPLDAEQTLPLIRDILQGVRFLHAADPPIVHGDLKSANVLVDSNFRAKIADFGLASRGGTVGTPFFMAPELLLGCTNTTESDVYAFGVLLWEVMTHRWPYEGLDMDKKEILLQVSNGSLRPDCDHGLDGELVECMEDCWAQDPAKRPNLEDLEMKIIPLCGQNLISVMQERNQVSNKQSSLLRDVFPEHIADALLAGKKVAPEHHDCVSVFFADIVGFTSISSELSPAEVSDLLDRLYIKFDDLAEKHGLFKLETIGDAWVGATNLTQIQPDHAARIARFSIEAARIAETTAIHRHKPKMGYVKIRVGFHTGPVVSSVVGTRNPRYCLFGDTMNTASRMESTSQGSRIHTSEYSARLAKEQDSRLMFSYRGKVSIKGKGLMKTYWLYNGDDADFDETESSEYINMLDGSSKQLLPPGEDIEMGSPSDSAPHDDHEDAKTAATEGSCSGSGASGEGEMDAASFSA